MTYTFAQMNSGTAPKPSEKGAGKILRFMSFVCRLICLLWAIPTWAQNGETLARSWCSACHAFPDPQLLDRQAWVDTVLPDMGLRLGFQMFRGDAHWPNSNAPAGTYADEPLMEPAEWEQIINWYETNAPAQLVTTLWQPRTPLELFAIGMPEKKPHDFPTSTAITIDVDSHRVLVGDSYEKDIEIYASDLSLLAEVRTGGAISRIRRRPDGTYLATVIGDNIGQTEQLFGLLIEFGAPKSGEQGFAKQKLRQLHRPVDMAFGDFNKDGAPDYVIAEFGAFAGKLSLHLSQPDGTLHKSILVSEAGSISVSVVGADLLVLLAQGDERILRLKNFASATPGPVETLLRFPPSQGSTSLRVLDFNGDGWMDLLYTAGDNADLSPIFKPYHGVYLYLGQSDGSVRLEMFFHLDGAYSTVAEDFDQDGDIDIAALSYFPRIAQGVDQAGFVYLQNSDGNFDPKYVKGLGRLGRFVALSAGDVDGDGDQDIALANLAFGPYGPLDVSTELQDQWLRSARFVLLRNTLR